MPGPHRRGMPRSYVAGAPTQEIPSPGALSRPWNWRPERSAIQEPARSRPTPRPPRCAQREGFPAGPEGRARHCSALRRREGRHRRDTISRRRGQRRRENECWGLGQCSGIARSSRRPPPGVWRHGRSARLLCRQSNHCSTRPRAPGLGRDATRH